MADGITVTVSGLLGGVASDTSSSNVSFSGASGATSKWIGVAAGALFILLGLSPKLSALLSIMPAPVIGAIVVFVVCFMMMSGLQIILTSKPDTRRIFVIGCALCFGLSLDIVPDLYSHLTPWLRPLFEIVVDAGHGHRRHPQSAAAGGGGAAVAVAKAQPDRSDLIFALSMIQR